MSSFLTTTFKEPLFHYTARLAIIFAVLQTFSSLRIYFKYEYILFLSALNAANTTCSHYFLFSSLLITTSLKITDSGYILLTLGLLSSEISNYSLIYFSNKTRGNGGGQRRYPGAPWHYCRQTGSNKMSPH